MRIKCILLCSLPVFIMAACGLTTRTGHISPQPQSVRTQVIPASAKALNNPFVGWAPWAKNALTDEIIPHTLVFAIMPWSAVEPQEGVFDFSVWEESVHFDLWSERSVRFVIRPVLDYPQSKAHMDIPQWLYDKMLGEEGKAGQSYNISYGSGMSPNYSSPALIEAHRKFLDALGKRYNANPNVAFIELGSVGHWGEWHVKYGSGLAQLPDSSVTDLYVRHYVDAFPEKMLLMRRPFTIALDEHLGLYDDSFPQDTPTWMDWIERGYVSEQTGEFFPAMPDYWKSAPAGGEFGTGMLNRALTDTDHVVTMIRNAHLSFLGPNCPVDWVKNGSPPSQAKQDAENSMRLALGYRFRVDRVIIPTELTPETPFTIEFVWKNDGNAPFYYPWPICISLCDSTGAAIWEETDWDIRTILPEEDISLFWKCSGLSSGAYTLSVAVFDPNTNEPGVYLAQEWEQLNMCYYLTELTIS